jgi:hypothetical protein
MAPKAKAAEVEEVEEAVIPGGRSQTAIHEGHAEWLRDTYGADIFKGKTPGEIMGLGFATRNAWRDTDTYQELKASLKPEPKAPKEPKAEKAPAAKKAASAKPAAKGKGKAKSADPFD